MALNGVDGVLVQRLIPVHAFSEGWRDHEVASMGNRNQTGPRRADTVDTADAADAAVNALVHSVRAAAPCLFAR